MLNSIKRHLNVATVLSLVALFFALGGGAYALKGKNSVDSGDIKNKTIKAKDVGNNKLTGAQINEATLALPDAPKVFTAAVAGGEVSRQTPTGAGIEAQDEGAGLYEVDFKFDVTQCTYNATLAGDADIPPNVGTLRLSREPGEATKVNVETFNAADAFEDRSFHIMIVCP